MNALVLAHAAITWSLVGLIWTIQLVHYPLFARVGAPGYATYAAEHSSRISLLVGPLMLAELLLAVALALSAPEGTSRALWWAGLLLLGVIWLSTAFVQVPLHARLGSGFVADAHAALVLTNWVRTVAWTARGVLAAWSLWLLLR